MFVESSGPGVVGVLMAMAMVDLTGMRTDGFNSFSASVAAAIVIVAELRVGWLRRKFYRRFYSSTPPDPTDDDAARQLGIAPDPAT